MTQHPNRPRTAAGQYAWLRTPVAGSESLNQILAVQEMIRRLSAPPNQILAAQEAIKRLTSTPTQIAAAQDAVRRLSSTPNQIAAAQEAITRLSAAPEFIGRLERTLEGFRTPDGLLQLANELRSVKVPGESVSDLSAEVDAQRAVSDLRTALDRWNADAVEIPQAAFELDSATPFSWIDFLPTVVQLRLWSSTLDVLSGVLLVIACVRPDAVPMGAILAAEVLIRLNTALLERIKESE